jgi:glycerol-3-phosphate dehydrogenase (NAD(P)+)
MTVKRAAVIGAGSWGTALAKMLSDKGIQITLWGHRQEHVDEIVKARENLTYLPGFKLGDNLKATADLQEAVAGQPVVVMVVPSHGYRDVFKRLLPYLAESTYVISAVKGIENNTLMTMDQVMEDEMAKLDSPPKLHLGVLAGPSFAKEVAAEVPTAVSVASKTNEEATFFQEFFNGPLFRVYACTDLIGLQLGGALKNIIAIAAGISDGLRYGAMGAEPLTFSGLGGLGDLVLTCTGDLSRNRTVGLKLGQGKNLSTILSEMDMVAEGVMTTRSAWDLASKMEVEMPILEQVYQVLYKDKPCDEAVKDLMSRSLKQEQW